jgi:hypothetical protein
MKSHASVAASLFMLLACEPGPGVAKHPSANHLHAPSLLTSAARPAASTATPASALPPLQAKPHASLPAPIVGAAFVEPPPWPDTWCPSLDSVWSDELSQKHGLPGVDPKHFEGCGIAVTWNRDAVDIGFGISAGRVDGNFASTAKQAASIDPQFRLRSDTHAYRNKVRVQIWSDEPPFFLSTHVQGFTAEERKRRARALAQDVLVRLKEPAFKKPMAEIVVVYPNFPREARQVLEQWDRLKLAYDATAPLAPGFPKLMKTEDFVWDAGRSPGAGKDLLVLAICPSGAGQHLQRMVEWALPFEPDPAQSNMTTFVAQAEGLKVMCPATALSANPLQDLSSRWRQPDGSVLGVMSTRDLAVAPGQAASYGAAVLFDSGGVLRDYAPFEMRKPEELNNVQGRFGHLGQRRRLGKCIGDIGIRETDRTTRVVCESLWSDYRCQVPEHVGTLLRFDVTAEQRIAVQTLPQEYPGRYCQGPE